MLHSIKDLENWLEKHGKILESKVEILEPNKPRYFISYDFYWNGEVVADVCQDELFLANVYLIDILSVDDELFTGADKHGVILA